MKQYLPLFLTLVPFILETEELDKVDISYKENTDSIEVVLECDRLNTRSYTFNTRGHYFYVRGVSPVRVGVMEEIKKTSNNNLLSLLGEVFSI